MLGSLETTVLLAALSTGRPALPSAIYNRIVGTTMSGSKEPSFGAVYTTVQRMERKGLLHAGSAVDALGRERRTFSVSEAGRTALKAPLHQFVSLGGIDLARRLAPAAPSEGRNGD